MQPNDGPASPLFSPIPFTPPPGVESITQEPLSAAMRAALPHAPQGRCISWGIPFQINTPLVLNRAPVTIDLRPQTPAWLVWLHTSDLGPAPETPFGPLPPEYGDDALGEHAADYLLLYADGSEARLAVRRRHQVGAFHRRWGIHCFEAVAQHKPYPVAPHHEQNSPVIWGESQTRVAPGDFGPWVYWLWAVENPHPDRPLAGVRCEPVNGLLLLAALSGGQTTDQPLRWAPRRKALLRLPRHEQFDPHLDDHGRLRQVQLDLGQVISAIPRPIYPPESWETGHVAQLPSRAENEVLVEYTAHPEACFHLADGQVIPVRRVAAGSASGSLEPVAPAVQRVRLRVVEASSGKRVPARLHLHGSHGEYLAPLDRHRLPNPAWFEDYSADYIHIDRGDPARRHPSTYIDGETVVDLPLGPVYVEISKGFEIRPQRRVLQVDGSTEEITIPLEKVLPWREKGWVSADTHVHFLSPTTARLEGSAEGVNVVNLLASQWGELMTNVGDFDGQHTWGSPETGGDGEWLVRVGTENRQHILGHISLLGYGGRIIAPMTTAGPDESALGDPLDSLLTEWARQCRQQGGLVVLPHFPRPRGEYAASLVSGDIDAVEMTSWENLYAGLSPYSLVHWYRYLNCGYPVAAVGGTDKMTAETAVGTVRTYAHLLPGEPFTYQAWMDAVRRGETFVTHGPLLEFAVEGQPAGSRLNLPPGGGTLDVVWQAASVTMPMSRVELVVNGEIRESVAVAPDSAAGSWQVKVPGSAWLALLVRGHHPGMPEVIAAHSSAVMVDVPGAPLLAAADALSILAQIEGALAYVDTLATQRGAAEYKRMRLVLEGAHRSLHNRMHAHGIFHGPH